MGSRWSYNRIKSCVNYFPNTFLEISLQCSSVRFSARAFLLIKSLSKIFSKSTLLNSFLRLLMVTFLLCANPAFITAKKSVSEKVVKKFLEIFLMRMIAESTFGSGEKYLALITGYDSLGNFFLNKEHHSLGLIIRC